MLQVGSYMRRGSPILLTRLIVGCPTGLVDERGEQEVRAFRAPGRLLYETSIGVLLAILFRLAMEEPKILLHLKILFAHLRQVPAVFGSS